MHQVKILIIALSVFSFSMHAMKRNAQEIEVNWGYKERKSNYLLRCCLPEGKRKYPYFVSEEKDEYARRSFLDELLFAHHLVVKNVFPKEITHTILRYSYQLHLRYNSKLRTLKEIFNLSDFEVCCLHKSHQQTLLFLERNRSLQIEGLDKQFAQKITYNIKQLPLSVKQKLIEKYGKNIESNTFYNSSLRMVLQNLLHDNLLDENDKIKDCCTDEEGKELCCICSGFISICMAVISAKISRFIKPAMHDDEGFIYFTSSMLLTFMISQVVTDSKGIYRKIQKCLAESPTEKQQRLGIQTIPLLQEMECTIIDQ